MDSSSALTELNTILGDSGDITFSAAEKVRALKRAWNDPYVVTSIWDDSSLTYAQGTYTYTLPDTITALQDIYIAATTSQPMPEPISNDLWELVAGNIQFTPKADALIPTGSKLYLKGRYKLDYDADTLDTVNLQEYVLSLAGANTLTLLAHKKANLFVKNDTSMSELIGLRRELMADVRELRTKLGKEFESA